MEFHCKFIFLAICIMFSLPLPKCNAAEDHQNPPEMVGKALGCFNHVVYTCPPEQRLEPTGTLNIPDEETDEYCNGGCYQGTKVVLACVDQILSNFVFYNKATIGDIRKTIVEGCSNTHKRGDFNVLERILAGSKANNIRPTYVGVTAIIFVIMWGMLSSL